uniref:Myotubularin phosphatase domain-containing protein n=1 Tax=Nannospalax galili TaxID=1026970 RepID=A0A8C6RPL3_NANGA
VFTPKPPRPTFNSYLPPPQTDDKINSEPRIKKLEPVLLPGEIVVNQVNFVRKCIATDTSQCDLWGKLICSNFKISFITDDPMPLQKFHYRNLLLGEHDVPLTCIEQTVTVNDHKRKQKVLGPNQKLKFNPTELIIYCKDFRTVRFHFDESGPESAKKLCLTIAHSQPTDLQLLFAFESVGKKIPQFSQQNEWNAFRRWRRRELGQRDLEDRRFWVESLFYQRGLRDIYFAFQECFVVPSSYLKIFSHPLVGRRLPLWSWSRLNGSALVRMALIEDVLQQRKIDQRICNATTKSHPQRNDVYKSDLDKTLPNIQETQAVFIKLKQLCVNEPFEETEEKWLSSLESTQWLDYVRTFLKHSAELVYMLESKQLSVVLQEEEGRDLSCLVASLVQVMMDPYFRTITGFQSPVQKEWITFLDRRNHLKRSEKESPLFLLFLDTTAAVRAISKTYLAVLCNSTRISLFGTFLFTSPHQWVKQSMEFAISKNSQLGDEKGLKFPLVWDWSLQFTAKDCTLFHNPFYIGKSTPCVQNGSRKSFKRTKKSHSSTLRGMPSSVKNGIIGDRESLPHRNSLILKLKSGPLHDVEQCFRERFSKSPNLHGVILPHPSETHIKLWKLCYFRWVPEAQINLGAFYKLSLLADEVGILGRMLRQQQSGPLEACYAELDQSRMYFRASGPHDTLGTPEFLSSSFPFSPVGNLCRGSILGTPLSKFLSGAKIWLSTETLANED